MNRYGLIVLVASATCLGASGNESPDKAAMIEAAEVYEKALQEVIRQAEPSVACVLVSRSDAYKKIFHDEPPADSPGKLGAFDASKAEAPPPRQGGRRRFGRGEFAEPQDPWKKYDLADTETIPETYGSGVVIDGQKLLVLTNYHVVRDATKVYVRLPGRKGSYADIHAADPRSDLAVLRLLDANTGPLQAVKFGDAETLKMGSFVVSLANPFAAGSRDGSPSASKGIVSKLGRAAMASSQEYPDERYSKPLYLLNTLITTDMNLNTGCSGGALLNLRGEMVGLTTARAAVAGSDKAGGFAIPINRAMRRIIDKLRAGLEVEYGFLGVNRDRQGTRVISGVVPGSPADHAGLRLGESIVSIDGVPIRDADDIYLTIATLLAGSTARIELAGNPPRSVSVTLVKSYVAGKIIASNRPGPVRGMRVDYSSALDGRTGIKAPNPWMGMPRSPQTGVYVSELQPESKAAALLRLNDVITHIRTENGLVPVNSPTEFYRLAEKVPPSQALELTVLNAEATVKIP